MGVVRTLLAAGAGPDARDKAGWTVLMRASSQGDLPVAEALLEGGAKVGTRSPRQLDGSRPGAVRGPRTNGRPCWSAMAPTSMRWTTSTAYRS